MKHLRRFKGFQGKLAEFVRGDDHEGWVCTAADLEVERDRTLRQAFFELEAARLALEFEKKAARLALEFEKIEELARMQQNYYKGNVTDFSDVVGELPLAPPPGTMHIFIRVPTGTTITLAVDGDETTVSV